MKVTIKDEKQKKFILSLLNYSNENPFFIKVNQNDIICNNFVIAKMLERLKQDKTVILPHPRPSQILWLLLNKDYKEVLQHSYELENILVNDYAEWEVGDLRQFKPQTEIGQYGAEMFPEGYLCFSSPTTLKKRILDAIELWLELDEQRPGMVEENVSTNAYVLRSNFHQALSLNYWEEAKEALTKLRQGHYISNENYQFLKLKLLSVQGKWQKIWESEEFSLIAGLHPLPKEVRQALLTAFYKNIIRYIEDDPRQTLEVFKKHRNRLYALLNYKAGLSGDIFIRIFAYEAAINNNLIELESLKEEAKDEKTLIIITELISSIEPPGEEEKEIEEITEVEEIEQLIKEYFQEGSYDEAYLYALELPFSLERTQVLLGIATMTESLEICESASQDFLELTEEEQEEILTDPRYKGWAKFVLGFSKSGEEDEIIEVVPIDWEEWFKGLSEDRYDKNVLLDCLQNFISTGEQTKWENSVINNIEDILLQFMISDSLTSKQKQLLGYALPDFAGVIFQLPDYPSIYAVDLYEYLLLGINMFCNKNTNNTEILLRLAEGLLQCDIDYCQKIWPTVEEWFFMQSILELSLSTLRGLELFNDYGLEDEKLVRIWNKWVSSLSDSFSQVKKLEIESWLQLGDKIGGEYNLLNHLEDLLDTREEVDHIKLLGAEVITIFSCRENAAQRAANKIMNRNSELEVRVCTDDSLTKRAKSYARTSDIVIVVTACISHALTYGIAPYLDSDPLYPRSSGETGIVDVMEEYAINRAKI